jgi:(p)ppGpp synthase/HD superfamily hydrolase
MSKYEKLKITLRYWLLGISQVNPEYNKCIEALEFASTIHNGKRKDGVTPEFEHQLIIAHYLRTLVNNLMFPSETICVAILHDVCEDYDVSYDEIERRFGKVVRDGVERLTKIYKGVKKSDEEYFNGISECPIASVGKGGDRIHNLQSMVGVFTKEKQEKYILEAETHIIPALKKARRLYPKQEMVYENIKLMMLSQIQLIKSQL